MRYEILCLASATGGILSHLLFFIHGYRSMQAPQIFIFYLIAECFLYARSIHSLGVVQGSLTASLISLCYFSALFTSITVYRIFFHRLRRFPGPFLAKVTKFYSPWLAWDGKFHERYIEFFEKYGDIVRVAPNELIVLSTDAQQKLHRASSRCSKEETVYELVEFEGFPNLEAMVDRDEHRLRRQVCDKAFSTKALESYESYARQVVYEWLGKMASLQGQPVNTSLYSLLIPFENMGRMGFSHNFGSIQNGKEDPMLHYLEITLGSIGKLGAMYWPIAMLNAIGGSSDHVAFEKLSCKMVDQREKTDEEKEDIMKYLLQDYHAKEPKAIRNHAMIYSDAQAVMVAGTDTIGAVLSFAFYYLARDPIIQKRLLAELEPLYGRTMSGEFTNHDLGEADAPYLNAIINETMRMHNPTCSNGPRMTPPEGLEVDGVFIPGKVEVYVPIHAMHRSAKFFREPNSFIPERWTTRPDLMIDKRAFHPFLLGPHTCVGRRIALIVVRLVLAYTTWYYEFGFAPGEDGVAIHRDSVNGQILKAGKLECVFKQRG